MRSLAVLAIFAAVSGCISIDRHYAAMDFDAFIDEQDLGPDLRDDAIRKAAYRAKWSVAGYVWPDSIEVRFARWCRQHDGNPVPLPAVVDGKFVPPLGSEWPFVPADIATPGGTYMVSQFGVGCFVGNRRFLGGLTVFSDHSVAFYAGR